ncbi:uncharacterized protein K452DRAFT_294336 [Aplosporella prunicola CBS 121167]|uniref:non-specific serine/threonine protein kinase n=1 Tax=Aplosporella prunicola CBS 121167 TaxID=1176127 RepID=A0A6A6BS21_9PEZI|nr:uncharacterized protein K452DRAFT_294336 [Aplosporella prunicola CBS 121167]KAF2146800.1 hypothetical protein K452DRAFT_294336 [Aplosporella prunicola CBS 121167]
MAPRRPGFFQQVEHGKHPPPTIARLTMPSVPNPRPARAKSFSSRATEPSPLSHRISSSLPPAPPSSPDPSSWGAALVILASPELPPPHLRSDKSPSLPDDWKLPDSACSLKRRNARRARERAMANSLLNPRTASSKARAIQEAQEAQRVVEDRAARSGTAAPPYDFLELIGKGSFGRVYKGKNRETNGVIAIKILEVDKADYLEAYDRRDDAVNNFLKETNILRTLKDSGAKNVNLLHDTFSVHSTLWIVSDYCPGGSVRTLCRANPNPLPNRPGPLEEKFIIPIARELAVALESVHQAGIVHRDLKCANVLIREDGCVQLCDFGVAGVLQSNYDRRATIIGTPHWMPPEMIREDIGTGYGFEIDVWEYGCTIYEMATGVPPNATTAVADLMLRTEAPRLDSKSHSQELADFIAFCLKSSPEERPSAQEVLDHPYLAGSEEEYPTESLTALIERFKEWESRGGNRSSLWHEGGAATMDPLNPQSQTEDDWVFSTTADFDRKFEQQRGSANDPSTENGSATEDKPAGPGGRRRNFALQQKAMKENQVRRGGEAMERLFNPDGPDYQYNGRYEPFQQISPRQLQNAPDRSSNASDLALRNYGGDRASNRVTMIDLDDGMVVVPDMDAAPTIRASRFNLRMYEEEEDDYPYQPNRGSKRATKDWKFPMAADPEPEKSQSNRKTMEWTFAQANRKTMEWSFASSMAEMTGDGNQDFRNSKIAQRRLTKDQPAPSNMDPNDDRRSFLPGFSFPMGPVDEEDYPVPVARASLQPSPPLGAAFRPQLKHAATQPIGNFDDFYVSQSAPESPNRGSMIDLDFADVTLGPRPATSATDYPEPIKSPEAPAQVTDSFDLEDQAQLSKSNNRASYHQKSQSAPHHRVSLLQAQKDDGYNQGYVSDNGSALQARDRLSKMLGEPSDAPVITESDLSVSNSGQGDFPDGPTEILADPTRVVDATIRASRHGFNVGTTPAPQHYIPYNYHLDDTPPSTSGGSFSSSNFASPDTAALVANEQLTQLTTPRTSVATYSPRSAISNFTQQSYDLNGDGIPLRKPQFTMQAARPIPPHPDALEVDADPRLMANEASKAAQQHLLYLKTLQRTLKMCGSQAQARRAGRKARMNGSGDSGLAASSVESSDVESTNTGGTVRRVTRRAESAME